MKNSKLWKLLLVVLTLTTMLSGCSWLTKTFPYSFRQDRSNIEKVEICAYDHDSKTRTPLTQLSDEHVDALLAELSAIDCGIMFPLDPILSYGETVICITYFDGEVEMIGAYNIGWISPKGKLHTTKYLFVNLQEIRGIIERYAKY